MYGLALDCRERHVLGPDIDIYIHEADKTNIRIRPERIAAAIAATGGLGLVTLVGVQSNQFPRAMDLAPLPRRRILVAIGGLHVSGCKSLCCHRSRPIWSPSWIGSRHLAVLLTLARRGRKLTTRWLSSLDRGMADRTSGPIESQDFP
jgi:hypothetical protein